MKFLMQTLTIISQRSNPNIFCWLKHFPFLGSQNKILYKTPSHPLKVIHKTIIDIYLLENIVQRCDSMHMGLVHKVAFRVSLPSLGFQIWYLMPCLNLITFNSCLERMSCLATGASLITKWSKTLQRNTRIKVHNI